MEQIAITAKHLNESHTPLQYCIFDENGGTIGSDSTNNFCLQDTEIQERHVSIQYEEGCFTIASIGDSNIFYNESFSALRAGYETTINLGDTFRNVFALSHGCGRYENSIDSVYTWTENGTWSKLNEGQQEFYNLQYFYDSIDFFDDSSHKNKIKQVAEFYCKKTREKVEMLNKKELSEFNSIKGGLKL